MTRVEPFQRPDRAGWWIKFRDPVRGQWVKRRGGETKGAATLKLAAIVAKVQLVEAGLTDRRAYEISERGKIPIAQVVTDFGKHLIGRNRSSAHVSRSTKYCRAAMSDGIREGKWVTRDDRRVRDWKVIIKPIGVACLADLRRGDVDRFLADIIASGRGPATRNEYLRAISAMCKWGIDDHRLAENPCAGIPMLNVESDQRRSRRAMTPDELASLLAVAPAERAVWYWLASHAGLRWGEIASLRWRNLDLDGGWIRLEASGTKAKRAEDLPMSDSLRAILAAWRVTQLAMPDMPVLRHRPGRVQLRLDLTRAGVRDPRSLSPHSLRRTFCTHLALAGVDVRQAQRLARHSDINLTLRYYTDPRLFDLRGAVESIGRLAAGKTQEKKA